MALAPFSWEKTATKKLTSAIVKVSMTKKMPHDDKVTGKTVKGQRTLLILVQLTYSLNLVSKISNGDKNGAHEVKNAKPR